MPLSCAVRTAASIGSSGRMPAKSRSTRLSGSTPRYGANRAENPSDVSSPFSSSRSSASASGLERKSSFTAFGSRPSASANSRNESKTLVVRTPPKSTIRARGMAGDYARQILGPARADADPSLGEITRHQRELAALSVREFARRAGISNPYLSQIERGLREPSERVLDAIADSLRTTT